jgi:hypothetical protein
LGCPVSEPWHGLVWVGALDRIRRHDRLGGLIHEYHLAA